jgi:hypothetical protein
MFTLRPTRRVINTAFILLVAIEGCSKMASAPFSVPPEIEHPWNPATEVDVQEVERKLGVRFPDDYREFLMSINGIIGEHDHLVVYEDDDADPWYVRGLHSISPDAPDYVRLLDRQHDCRFDVRAPKRLVVIGRTLGWDLICMSVSGRDRGCVYGWYEPEVDIPSQLEPDSMDHLSLLGGTFREFWSKLRVAKDDE